MNSLEHHLMIDDFLSEHNSCITLEKETKKNAKEIAYLQRELNNALEAQKNTLTQLEQSKKNAAIKITALLPNANLEEILPSIDALCRLKNKYGKSIEDLKEFSTDVEEHFQGIDVLIKQKQVLGGTYDYHVLKNLNNAKINLFDFCETIELYTLHDGIDSPDNIYDEDDYDIWYPSLKEYINSIKNKFTIRHGEFETKLDELEREIFIH